MSKIRLQMEKRESEAVLKMARILKNQTLYRKVLADPKKLKHYVRQQIKPPTCHDHADSDGHHHHHHAG